MMCMCPHRGKRSGAGRKAKGEYALNIQVKVNAVELEFLKQARELGVGGEVLAYIW